MMSFNDTIKKLLNINDENIIISEENCLSEEVIDGVRTTVIEGRLFGEPAFSDCCELPHIIKHGFLTTHVLLPRGAGSNLKTMLRLHKQRHTCKNCRRTEVVITDLVDKHCTISNPLKLSIFHDATKKRSEVDIAYDNHVSNTTVARVIDNIYEEKQLRLGNLPKVLLFDEFKSTKDAEGAMSFIVINGDNSQIVDMLESRTLAFLRKYFSAYTKEAREKVEMIVMDMYAPYMSLVRSLFPNAKIVLDRFHIVGLVNTAMKFTRINIMNQFDKDTREYKRLKYDWKLLQKNKYDLSEKRYYCRRWRAWITNKEKIEWLIDLDKELARTYFFYQSVLSAIRGRNKNELINLLENPIPGISSRMKVSINSMLNYREYTLNALDTHHSNGRIEGVNNFIKVVKRIAFGYRSFVRFKARVLMIHEYNPIKAARLKKEKEKIKKIEKENFKANLNDVEGV